MPVIEPPAIEITHIGGPTTRVSIAGRTFIIDPTFDAPGREYSSGPVRLTKTAGPAMSVEQLGRIDVALVSHDQHPDNLDVLGRALLNDIPLVLTTVASAQRLGRGATGLAPWQTHEIPAEGVTLSVTATPAQHGPLGAEQLTGAVTGFVISVVESGADLVYLTGDTMWFDGTAQVAQRFEPRVVVLFGGAAMTARGPFHLTMTTNDAIEAAGAFKLSTLIPVHYEGWAHFTQSPDDFLRALNAFGFGGRLQMLAPGEPRRF